MIARKADAKRECGELTGPWAMRHHNQARSIHDDLPGDAPSRAGLGSTGMEPEDLEDLRSRYYSHDNELYRMRLLKNVAAECDAVNGKMPQVLADVMRDRRVKSEPRITTGESVTTVAHVRYAGFDSRVGGD